jgi:long-chain acyl-CoA synthetase
MTAAQTVPEALDAIFANYANETAFVYKQPFFRQAWAYRNVESRVWQMVAFLQSKGLKHGDSVAICGPNSPWWLVVYLACTVQGIIVVPLDFNSSSEFIDKVITGTDTKLFFKSVYKVYEGDSKTVLLEDLAYLMSADIVERPQLPDVSPEDTLEIVFTSGSTGTPKGVVLTHANVMSNVANFLEAWPPQRRQTSLSLVPLSHMLEQTAGFWAPFYLGCTIVYISSLRPTEITSALCEERITCIITVPAFLQLLRRRIMAQMERSTGARELIRTASKLPAPAARLVSWPVRSRFGSQLHTLAVGGAALPADVEDFWTGLGYSVIQGYGLTEASPLVTYSSRVATRARSVGKGLPNQELRIAEKGELLLCGPHIFRGYYQNNEATKQVLDNDGWFHTGDIAEIDADGFVFLKGRLKNMLLGANGRNIYPEDIEAKLLNYSDIRDVVVLMANHGDESKLTAVVLTDKDGAHIRQIIHDVNQTLASHQAIQDHIIWPDTDFPRTPTRKIRRQEVQNAVDNRKTDEPFIPTQDASQVQMVLRQVSGTTKSITSDMTIAGDLAVDSIKRLELVTILEEKLLVSIDETMITPATTVGQLEQLIDKTRKSNANGASRHRRGVTRNRLMLALQSAAQGLLLRLVGRYQRLEVSGAEFPEGPVIFVANHSSHLDAPTFLRIAGFRGRQKLVIAAAADYFFSGPIRSWLSRNLIHAVPVEREGAIRGSLELIGRELSLGRSVVIFPEGTRSTDGNIKLFKPGIGLLAASLQVPIVPVRLKGNFTLLPKGARWLQKGITTVNVGEARAYSVSLSPEEITGDLQQAVEDL